MTALDVTSPREPSRRSDAATAPRRFLASGWPWLAVAAAGAISIAVLLHAGRETTFFFDEWDWVQSRRANTLDSFLAPHNGHLSVVPVAIYKLLFAAVGLSSYVPYRLVALGLHLTCAALLFVYLRRRLEPIPAVVLAVIVLLLGFAWQDLLWPFQIGYFGSVAGALGALLLLDRRDRRGDIWASVCIAVSIACSGIGLPVAGAVFVELAWRRDTWRRLWVPIVPVVLYGMWYLSYGESQAKSSNLHLVGSYTLRSAAGASGALAGVHLDNGRYLVGAFAAVVALKLAHDRGASPRLAAVLTLPALFWGLTALSRGHLNEPAASRYLYPGAIFLVLVLAELVRGSMIPRVAAVVLVVFAAYSIRGNLHELDGGASGLRGVSQHVKAELTALELARPGVAPDYRPDPDRMPQIRAGAYFAAIDALGSPAESVAALRRQPEEVRSAADRVLLDARRVALGPPAVPGGAAPSPAAVAGGVVTRDQSCVVLTPSSPMASMELAMPMARLEIDAPVAPVDVRLRAFADAFSNAPRATVTAGAGATLALPALRRVPWRVQLSSSGPLRVCATR